MFDSFLYFVFSINHSFNLREIERRKVLSCQREDQSWFLLKETLPSARIGTPWPCLGKVQGDFVQHLFSKL